MLLAPNQPSLRDSSLVGISMTSGLMHWPLGFTELFVLLDDALDEDLRYPYTMAYLKRKKLLLGTAREIPNC